MVILLVYFVDEASNIDGVREGFGAASDGDCRDVRVHGLSSVGVTAGGIDLWFDLRTAVSIACLRSQLDVSCYWSNISGLCKQI
jgi:hypothetical protein